MKEFAQWISPRKQAFEHLLDEERRISAFALGISTQKLMTGLDFVVRAFGLDHDGNDYLVPCVRAFVLRKKFKEVSENLPKRPHLCESYLFNLHFKFCSHFLQAGQCISQLGLQDHFKFEEVSC